MNTASALTRGQITHMGVPSNDIIRIGIILLLAPFLRLIIKDVQKYIISKFRPRLSLEEDGEKTLGDVVRYVLELARVFRRK